MDMADRIHNEVRRLPDLLAQEVLDFIGYLEYRHGLKNRSAMEDLTMAQGDAMRHVWDNPEDEVWNDVPTR
ncbi:MAG: hypothetical protein HQM03_12425 [Magnetococcales bacterium]|nr:hypothetical protein [Magnetococcales bacterium]